MKVGLIGIGGVGAATLTSLIMRQCAKEIVLIDTNQKRAEAIALDVGYGIPLSTSMIVNAGHYTDLTDSKLVIITAGINEKTGGATNKNDPAGRLRLLETNAGIYKDIVSQIKAQAPNAVILVVTDPPDPLADLTRMLTPQQPVVSAGTFLDSMRFRVHVAKHFNISPKAVKANVIGEHGVSEVFLWSSVSVGGVPLSQLLKIKGVDLQSFKAKVEQEVRFANINIIEGNNASQYGIGMVTARIAEMISRDEKMVVPIGSYQEKYGVTLSLPSVVDKTGISEVFKPVMTEEENKAFIHSVEVLKEALGTLTSS